MPSVNPQVHRDASRRWRQTHPQAVKAQKALFYERHKERLKEKLAPRNRARAKTLRQALLALFGGKCCRCGFDDPRALQIDHVNGGGGQERKALQNAGRVYKKVLADQTGYQLLCANCNWIKKYEEHEHRWKLAVGVIPRLKTTSTISED